MTAKTVTTFKIEITVGSDNMKLPTDIAMVLAAIEKQLPNVIMSKGISTKIKDSKGNIIGKWSYE